MNDKPAPDPEAWLLRHGAEEWIRLGLRELERASSAFAAHNAPAAAAALKRAAGMALNGALVVARRPEWGRSFVDHLRALREDAQAPGEVRQAAEAILGFSPGPGSPIILRTLSREQQLLEAARTVMAHSYAIVHGGVGRAADSSGGASDPRGP